MKKIIPKIIVRNRVFHVPKKEEIKRIDGKTVDIPFKRTVEVETHELKEVKKRNFA